ncbi:MAG TPA: hypothetical protein V6C86_21085 [Oculatellaceae cyanobacterium]
MRTPNKNWLEDLKRKEQRKRNQLETEQLIGVICDLSNLLEELQPIAQKIEHETDEDVKAGLLLLAKEHVNEALTSLA